MTFMKLISLFLIAMISSNLAIAGGGGGGGVLAAGANPDGANGSGTLMSKVGKEVVFLLPAKKDLVKFAYGVKTPIGWEIQTIEMTPASVEQDVQLSDALSNSLVKGTWIEIAD